VAPNNMVGSMHQIEVFGKHETITNDAHVIASNPR
jgi:hypothetical protein